MTAVAAVPQPLVGSRLRGRLLLAAFLLNPLLYLWWHTTGGVFPDSVSYLLLARELLEHGRLFVPSAGHVDTALILPPVYPFVVGLVSSITGDAILASQWINAVALLVATAPLFLWVERAANAWTAAAAMVAIQWQPFYVLHGTSTLTEAFFVLGISLTVVWGGGLLTRRYASAAGFFGLGVALAALLLTRALGLFMLPVLLAAMTVVYRRDRWSLPRLLGNAALLAAGFGVVAGAYAWVLHAQTGQMPWTQSFRMNQYGVTQANADASAAVAPSDYRELYAQRREMRRLLPDGSEMTGYLVQSDAPSASPLRWLVSPAAWLGNFGDNLRHVRALLGGGTLALAALGAVLCLLRPGPGETFVWRLLLPAVGLGYLAFLSLLTGLVERYVEVILPFTIALAATGAYVLLAAAGRRLATAAGPGVRPPVAWAGFAAALAAAVVLSSPAPSFAGALVRNAGERTSPLAQCRPLVTRGEGVFSFHPIEAYLLDASYRIVPNAELGLIAAYGRHIGTRWLLFRSSNATAREVLLYSQARWLSNPAEALLADPNFAPRCGSPGLGAVLFEIVNPAGDEPAG